MLLLRRERISHGLWCNRRPTFGSPAFENGCHTASRGVLCANRVHRLGAQIKQINTMYYRRHLALVMIYSDAGPKRIFN